MDQSNRVSDVAGQLFLELQRTGRPPLHQQLEAQLRHQIRRGILHSNLALPPSRVLAADLGVSRGVVVEAYRQLIAEGYLISRSGGHTRVAPRLATAGSGRPSSLSSRRDFGGRPRQPAIDFRFSRPDVSQFPRAAWLRATRKVLAELPHSCLADLDGHGAPELREVIADYLNRVRGTSARSDNIVISNGFAQAARLVFNVLSSLGFRCLAVESPSEGELWDTAVAAGLDVVGVPVRASGLDVAALDRTAADVVLLTAAHQFPTGAVLSADSRRRDSRKLPAKRSPCLT